VDVLRVIAPGPLSTVQDLGRYGWQRFGVPVSGALDDFSHRVANRLVGNPDGAATLEMTLAGAKLEALAPVSLAVAGADMPLSLNQRPVEAWQCLRLEPGDVLTVGTARAGVRAYLALAGGIEVPRVMGSRSTNLGGGFGGLAGRSLRRGDVLAAGAPAGGRRQRRLPPEHRPAWERRVNLRALPGPQDDYFDQGLTVFFASEFTVTPDTDRVGCRLQGPEVPLARGRSAGIISEPLAPGGVQVPADGQPIILLGEQTVGGYAKIATVLSVDLPRVAQLRPGDRVAFRRVDLDEAHRLYRRYHQRLQEMSRLMAVGDEV